jgi:2-oxoglutarate dehydrogenase E2 component (dihydrolipoamide succinyltransferase)
MSIEVLVPNLPESVSDATLITWHKQAGDTVIKNENLVDLETDKVVLEVPAPESGILAKILKKDGSVVVGGDILAILEPQAVPEQPKTDSASTPEHDEPEMPLSPSVRRLIAENALDPLL